MPIRFSRVLYVVAAILLAVESRPALAQDELFVTNFQAASVTVYARTANGNVAPLRTLVGFPITGLAGPFGLAVDTVNNEMVVVNNATPSVTVYPGRRVALSAPCEPSPAPPRG